MNAPPGDETDAPLIERVLGHLALDRRESGREALAEDAVWLALCALDGRCDDDLDAFLEGDYWEHALPGLARSESGGEGLRLGRTALGLLLVREAADPAGGSAERTACALAALALGCADPDVGGGLQGALATVRLLDVSRQIPVALHVRQLAFEFRHLALRPPPTDYMARVEDALERFDAERLLPFELADRRPHDPLSVHLQALAQTRSPTLLSLARVLLAHPRFADGPSTLAACRLDAPHSWRDPGALARLETAYGKLRGLLADTPYALCPRGQGYGLAQSEPEPPASQ